MNKRTMYLIRLKSKYAIVFVIASVLLIAAALVSVVSFIVHKTAMFVWRGIPDQTLQIRNIAL